MNKITTPGPPLKQASPKLLKLPAPMIAAIPKKVRSFTVSTLVNPPPPCPSAIPSAASFTILSMDFVRNKELAMLVYGFKRSNYGKKGENGTGRREMKV
jgi:hypothetical protein